MMTDPTFKPLITENMEPRKRNLLEEYFRDDLEGIILNEEFLKTLKQMENSSDNLIITGKAGIHGRVSHTAMCLKIIALQGKRSAHSLSFQLSWPGPSPFIRARV